MKYLLIFFIFVSITGCTARGWYGSMQQAASKECEKYPYQSAEYEKCIEKANISYDQYHREITDNTKQQSKTAD